MDPHVDRFKKALALYQQHPMEWSLLYGVLLAIAVMSAGIGIVLAPNAIRATRDALKEERAPDVGRLFQVENDQIMEDAIAAFGLLVATLVAGSFTGPLATLVSIVLGLAPELVTEEEIGGIDALQMSAQYVQKQPGPVFIHGLIATVVNIPGACCLFPLIVTMPISAIAYWLFYEEHRDDILGLTASP